MNIDEVTENCGMSCWGNSEGEAGKLLEITEKIRQKQLISPEDKALASFISMAFTH